MIPGRPSCPACGTPAVHFIRNHVTGETRWTCMNAHSWTTGGGQEALP